MWEEVKYLAIDIYTGYKNLILYKLGLFSTEDTKPYLEKKKVCNESCPLYSKKLGIGYCNPHKEFDDTYGCGCIIDAKLWSDSPCPLNRF